MKLVLLGTGGYFPTAKRQTACLMLPEVGIVLDAGTGMYRIGRNLQTKRLDIFLTHTHLDHIAGLTYLLNLVPKDVLAATTVHGEPAKLGAVGEHLLRRIFSSSAGVSVPAAGRKKPPAAAAEHLHISHSCIPVDRSDIASTGPILARVRHGTTAIPAANLHRSDSRRGSPRARGVFPKMTTTTCPKITGHSSLPTVVQTAH